MREIIERGRSRGYVLSLLFTVFLVVAGFILPSILIGDGEPTRLALVGDTPEELGVAIQAAGDAYELEIVISAEPDRAAAVAALAGETIDAALLAPADLSDPGELLVVEEANGPLQAAVTQSVIGLRAGADALRAPAVTALEPPSDSDMTALLFANAGIIVMFIGILSYGTWVLTGVVEEKQSRVVEVVLSTVRARDLLMGKVLGIGVLAVIQILLLVAIGIGVAVISGRLTLPQTTASAVVMLLTWFVLGFAFYATSMGVLGALASRMEEASNASMPVTLAATTAYILSLVVVTGDPNGTVATVLTFVPPAAPMVVPMRAALDAIAPWEIAVSIGLMLVAIWILFVIGARVYSGAVLQTGGRMKIRDAWRAAG
jgi:ABC-2 type transport system permease protein